MSGPTIGDVGTYSVNGGFRIDGSVTQFWATKPKAIAAAKAIGWPVNSVQPVYTRFQKGWGLGWGITKPGPVSLVSRVEFSYLAKGILPPNIAIAKIDIMGERRPTSPAEATALVKLRLSACECLHGVSVQGEEDIDQHACADCLNDRAAIAKAGAR